MLQILVSGQDFTPHFLFVTFPAAIQKKEHLSPGVEGGPFILDSASTNFFISSLHQVYQF